ncbi:MAG: hypothetical protein ACJARE_003802, partial [Paracoccaceae bacterium]
HMDFSGHADAWEKLVTWHILCEQEHPFDAAG